jgi:peroxidase
LIAAAKPDYSDETIYQETRRIVGATFQSIVYGQYLPVVMGTKSDGSPLDGIGLNAQGSSYDPQADPSMTNEFATAAYRLVLVFQRTPI